MHRKYWLVAMLVYVLVFGLALYSILLQRSPRAENPNPPLQGGDANPAVTYHISYRCGHEVSLAPSDGLSGLHRYLNLDSNAIAWELGVISTSTTGVVQNGYVDDLCRECQTYVFVGVKDGYVAVYYGLPRNGAELRFITDIPISRLPPNLQEELTHGILIRSEEELQRFLEGIDH